MTDWSVSDLVPTAPVSSQTTLSFGVTTSHCLVTPFLHVCQSVELYSVLTRLKKCCPEVAGFAHSQQLTVSEAGNPPVHKEARYDSTALQAREGADRGHYWYGQRFCLGKSLRECYQLLLIVWLCILSKCGWYVLLELERQGYFQMIGTCVTLTISSPLNCVYHSLFSYWNFTCSASPFTKTY